MVADRLAGVSGRLAGLEALMAVDMYGSLQSDHERSQMLSAGGPGVGRTQ